MFDHHHNNNNSFHVFFKILRKTTIFLRERYSVSCSYLLRELYGSCVSRYVILTVRDCVAPESCVRIHLSHFRGAHALNSTLINESRVSHRKEKAFIYPRNTTTIVATRGARQKSNERERTVEGCIATDDDFKKV